MSVGNTTISRFCAFLCLILWIPLLAPEADAQDYRDTLSIYFRKGKADYDSSFFDNGRRFAEFYSRLDSVLTQGGGRSNCNVRYLNYLVTCSPEGPLPINYRLVKERYESVIGLLPKADSTTVTYELDDKPWPDLLNMLESDLGLSVPYRDEAIAVVRSIIEGSATSSDLISLRGSEPWRYMEDNLFPSLRRFRVIVAVSYTVEDLSDSSKALNQKASLPDESLVSGLAPLPYCYNTKPEIPKNYMIELKTNLLYDLAAVANLSCEVGFAKHFSTELLFTFSPWDYGRETLQFRTALLQPEFRYWFSEGWTRHFVGLHAHLGWYNIAPGGKVRYQDRNGNTPLAGVGLSYGYVLPFTSHWGAEFSVGAGYAYLSYDKFYNIHNGAQFGTGEKHYFGLTKLGVSIYYRF